jgi:hypothetical protein
MKTNFRLISDRDLSRIEIYIPPFEVYSLSNPHPGVYHHLDHKPEPFRASHK